MKNSKRTILIAILIFSACTLISSGEITEKTSEERVLHFPKDRSLGEIRLMDVGGEQGFDYSHLSYPYFWNLEYLGEARGDVKIPAGKWVWLMVNKEASKDLSSLSKLGPNDIYLLSLDLRPALNESLADDDCMEYVGGLTGLKVLCLEGTRITNKGLSFLGKMKFLETLSLPARINNEGLKNLKGLKSLKSLYLSGSRITDRGLAGLLETTSLKDIYLDLTPNYVPTLIRELPTFLVLQSARRSVAEPGGLQLAANTAGLT